MQGLAKPAILNCNYSPLENSGFFEEKACSAANTLLQQRDSIVFRAFSLKTNKKVCILYAFLFVDIYPYHLS